MSNTNQLNKIIQYWLQKSRESLEAAHDEFKAGRLSFAVNRIYYACFYAVSALLMQKELRFKKHSGVRAAFHQNFVKKGEIDREQGRFYDEIFEARQRGDYIELVNFETGTVKNWLHRAGNFLTAIGKIIE
jgi:uncharacterized protein (UPF0332 family)